MKERNSDTYPTRTAVFDGFCYVNFDAASFHRDELKDILKSHFSSPKEDGTQIFINSKNNARVISDTAVIQGLLEKGQEAYLNTLSGEMICANSVTIRHREDRFVSLALNKPEQNNEPFVSVQTAINDMSEIDSL